MERRGGGTAALEVAEGRGTLVSTKLHRGSETLLCLGLSVYLGRIWMWSVSKQPVLGAVFG